MSDGPHTTRPLELDLQKKCRHGATGAHWYVDPGYEQFAAAEPRRLWCAGPPRDPLLFEPWRQKLEWQMNLLPHPIDGVHRIDGAWEAWVEGKLVAAGPTKEIIEAAYEHHKPRTVPTEPEMWAVHPQSVLLDLLPEGTDWQVPSELRHERLTTEELHTVQVLHDSLKDFKPLGWFGFGRFVWYDEPIYNALVKEYGYDPLADYD